ncbi:MULTISPECIES: hypothetical protein [Rhizobium]|nr:MULTISPECIES: hypothetical protein [Rhizobium]
MTGKLKPLRVEGHRIAPSLWENEHFTSAMETDYLDVRSEPHLSLDVCVSAAPALPAHLGSGVQIAQKAPAMRRRIGRILQDFE